MKDDSAFDYSVAVGAFRNAVKRLIPNAEFATDCNGQIIIFTKLCENAKDWRVYDIDTIDKGNRMLINPEGL